MDIRKIRRDFSILRKKTAGKPIVYLDSACMALKPDRVIDAMDSYYREFPACGGAGRSSHSLGRRVDREVYEARDKIRKLINARPCEDPGYRRLTPTKEIIFTSNATEAINLVANSFAFGRDAVVLTSDREHNSNLCPWKELEKKGVARHLWVPSNDDGTFNLERLESILKKENVRLVSMVHMSNLDGYELPAAEIIELSHKYGAKVLLDGAQSVPHIPVDVQELDVDFLAFSMHKMCGPTGMGVLYGKEELLNGETFGTFRVGGDTVEDTYLDKPPRYLDSPFRFEAGLQNYAGIVGAGAAVDYITGIGLRNIDARVRELSGFLAKKLAEHEDEFEILGVRDPGLHCGIFTLCFHRRGVVSLLRDGLRGIDSILNAWSGIMVRSGEFCLHSWFHDRKISREREKIRVSLYFYNTEEECELFVRTLAKVMDSEEYRMLPKMRR